MLNYKLRKVLACIGVAICLVGCSDTNTNENATQNGMQNMNENRPGNMGNMGNATSSNIELMKTDDFFSERDKKTEYDSTKAITVTLEESTAKTSSSNVVVNGGSITILKEGIYVFTGNLSNGQIIVDADEKAKVQIVLDNANISMNNNAAIFVKEADKVFVTTSSGSKNVLKAIGEFKNTGDTNVDATIFSKVDITFNGKGTLEVCSETSHGIVSKDELVITSGDYLIDSSSHCLDGKDNVKIAGGSFVLKSDKDGIHSENTDDTSKGYIYIQDGKFEINVSDDGISGTGAVQIDGGELVINAEKEGIEGYSLNILGGEINISAGDDGLNVSGGREGDGTMYVNIAGGITKLNAKGDGVDSNGNFYVSAGELYVEGPVSGANGTLDYAGEGKITGGILFASGNGQMEQNISSATQGVMLVSVEKVSNSDTVILKDSTGKVIFEHNTEKAYSTVVISTPDIKENESYTLITGGKETTIQMTSIIYGEQGGFGGGKNPGGMGGFPGDRGDFSGEMPEMPSDMGGFPGEMPEMPSDMGGFPGNKGDRPRK